MKAIVQEVYGSPDVLELKDIEKPPIKDNEVLLRVRAAAVNPPDWAGVTGVPYIVRAAFGLRKPRIGVRGSDVAGTVEAVGRSETRLHVGDEVFGAGVGTFAECAAAAADDLVPKPANVTFEQAAAVPMAGLTALQALRDGGHLRPGQKVLINGAGGGVGTFAVQIAKVLGAEVTGVCSTGNVDTVRSLGADHVIDYSKEDFTQGEPRYDLILDNVASHSFAQYRRVLDPGGTLMPNSGHAGMGYVFKAFLLSLFVRQQERPFVSASNQDDLITLKELVEAGRVTPVIDRTYPLRETAEAFRYLDRGHARGKVVIVMDKGE